MSLFGLEQTISDVRRTIVMNAMVPRTPGELLEIDHRQERLDWMRAEFRDAQQRRYEKAAILAATTTALAKPAPGPRPEPTLPPLSPPV